MHPKLLAERRAAETALAGWRQVIGMLVVALLILAVVVMRAPAHWLFPQGWWRF